jgi:hypothetical protein
MVKMLNYLNKINSPLYNFLSNHVRIKELTAIQPYPKLTTNVLNNKLPYIFLVKQAIAFNARMTLDTIKNNIVYLLLPINSNESQDCYIGSRIAGSNRNVGYLDSLRCKKNIMKLLLFLKNIACWKNLF